MSVCLHVCVCTTCIFGAHGGQKRVLDPLELQLFVRHHVGVRHRTWVLCRSSLCSSLLTYLFPPLSVHTFNPQQMWSSSKVVCLESSLPHINKHWVGLEEPERVSSSSPQECWADVPLLYNLSPLYTSVIETVIKYSLHCMWLVYLCIPSYSEGRGRKIA